MRTPFSRTSVRVAVPLLLLAGVVGFTGYHYASASTPYSVQSGDTLLDIANKSGVDAGQLDLWVSQVVALNGLSSPDALTIGQQLTLPVVVSGGGGGSAGGGVSSTTQAPAPASSTSYTVKDGDTLYAIAGNNGVTDVSSWVDSVLALNSLDSPDNINVGDVIKLPAAKSSSSTSSGSSTSSSSAYNTSSTTQYTVQTGDTLYDIAVKNGVSDADLDAWVSSVIKLNNLDSPDMLALGAALKVPTKGSSSNGSGGNSSSSAASIKSASTTNYMVKVGDTLYDIATNHGVKDSNYAAWVDAVLTANNMTSPNVLTAGDTLKIPDLSSSGGSSSNSASSSSSGSGSSSGSSSSSSSVTTSTTPSAAPSFAFSGASVTYAVKSGDTWSSIASKLGVPAEQVSFWTDNALSLSHMSKDDKLTDGVVLLIPSDGSITSTTPKPAAASTATTSSSGSSSSSSSTSSNSSTASNKPTSIYTVVSGDTLDDIATKYKVSAGSLGGSISDVLSLNNLSSADVLSVGQKLTVPGAPPDASSSSSSSAPPPATAASGTVGTVPSTKLPPRSSLTGTVTPGSSTTSSNSTAAPTSTPSVKKSGSTCYYTVLAGDSWDSISAKLGVSNDKKQDWIDGISALNGLKNNALPVGDAIRLLC